MSLGHGAKIVIDNLVFAYDMGSRQSWKGKPTTNLIPVSPLATDTKTKTGDYCGTHKGILRTGIANDNPRTYWFNSSATVSASTTYTLSCLYWSSDGVLDDVYLRFTDTGWPESNSYIQPFTSQSVTRNGSFTITDIGDNWKYCVGTFDTLATTTTLNQCFFDVDIVGRNVFIANVQFEEGSIATPFVNGTRSNAQALLDWTGDATITATSLTYNSDNTFEFLGSENSRSDMLTISDTSYPNTWDDPYSLEAMIYIPTGTTWYHAGSGTTIVGRGGYGGSHGLMRSSSNRIGFWQRSDTMSRYPAASLSHDTWYHVVGTNDGAGNMKFYLNGELVASDVLSWTSLTMDGGSWLIGGGNAFGGQSGLYGGGKIPLSRLYSKALTAQEVQKNFNSLRGRFGV